MEIVSGLLCDAASVREGLLHVLGAGITRLWRPVTPAPLNVTLATVARMDEGDLDRPHEINFDIRATDGLVAHGVGALQTARPNRLEEGERVIVPFVNDLRNASTPFMGRHTISLSADGVFAFEIEFWVLHPEERILPPL